MVYEFEKFEFEKYPPAEAITFGVLSWAFEAKLTNKKMQQKSKCNWFFISNLIDGLICLILKAEASNTNKCIINIYTMQTFNKHCKNAPKT